jgi:hypothetical protein
MSDVRNALADAAVDAYSARARLAGVRALVGFDGFVDNLVRVVRDRDSEGRERYFSTTKEFGEFIAAAGGSRSFELARNALKAGGNMPIVASALGSYGIGVSCVGALGYPARHTVFKLLPDNCEALSFADPGKTTALEFDDDKIMLGEMEGLHEANWDLVKSRIGLGKLRSLASSASLVGFLNWGEIDASDGIWRGMLEEVLDVPLPGSSRRLLLFDLSDCAKRQSDGVRKVVSLIADASSRGELVLSLNANEARLVASATGAAVEGATPAATAEVVRHFLGTGSVVIHYRDGAVSADGSGLYFSPALQGSRSLRATGSGDNFNAGYCIGALLGFDAGKRLDLGNAFAGYYRSTGKSPEPGALSDFWGLPPGEPANN